MKRIICLVLVFATALIALTACSGEKKDTSTAKSTASTVKKTETFKDVKYYIKGNASRYKAYQNENADMSVEDVVYSVNINKDLIPYEDTFEIQNPYDDLVMCNKFYYMPDDYSPNDIMDVPSSHCRDTAKLRKDAYDAFLKMCKAMKKEDLNLVITTAYRNYGFQKTLYDNYVAKDGVKEADTYSARPGFSEHQTGLAMDLGGKTSDGSYSLNNFEGTEEDTWMRAHAAEYGFINRFPKDKEDITGYEYEPWHYRYVGVEAAKIIKEKGLCLEEYWAMYIYDQTN